MIGFPGGLVDPGEDLEMGLNREMAEELGSKVTDVQLTVDHYLMSHYSDKIKLCVHFYTKGIEYEHFLQLERNSTSAKDHGLEVRCLSLLWFDV